MSSRKPISNSDCFPALPTPPANSQWKCRYCGVLLLTYAMKDHINKPEQGCSTLKDLHRKGRNTGYPWEVPKGTAPANFNVDSYFEDLECPLNPLNYNEETRAFLNANPNFDHNACIDSFMKSEDWKKMMAGSSR